MRDSFGREINYMRISITDRCNLRCNYCMPNELPPLSHQDILRYEEILKICSVAANIGIRTIKVTGGEPLVRKGCIPFLQVLKSTPGIDRVTLTTNGILLAQYIDELVKMKLDGVNISIDSLNAENYRHTTGSDSFSAVWTSLNDAVQSGLHVKINCVPIRGQNDKEIIPLARLTEILPIDVRFIEYMPTNESESFSRITGAEILNRLSKIYPDLAPDESSHGSGPARYFKSDKMQGSIGIIDAFENTNGCFCPDCNRIRLTSYGFLKLCLFHEDGLDLRKLLRNGASDSEIETAIISAIHQKPAQHQFGSIKNMSKIGG